jgi:hypothetical protein
MCVNVGARVSVGVMQDTHTENPGPHPEDTALVTASKWECFLVIHVWNFYIIQRLYLCKNRTLVTWIFLSCKMWIRLADLGKIFKIPLAMYKYVIFLGLHSFSDMDS